MHAHDVFEDQINRNAQANNRHQAVRTEAFGISLAYGVVISILCAVFASGVFA